MKNKKEKKGTLLKDAMALFTVTLVAALALTFVYEMTKAPIADQEKLKKERVYQAVYPDTVAELDEELTMLTKETSLSGLNSDYNNVTIDEISKVYDSNKNHIGYIIQVSSKGYNDTITLMFGYSLEGAIQNLEFLSLNETAGLGMNASEPEFLKQFHGKSVNPLVVTKTGATEDNQIDAISSATITTNAVVKAVNAGIDFLKQNADIGGGANE
ncbi:MAG TPA: FMN-binding protein [Mobilitalea sp.]|nr:FMN-binding protein [Mobilitalea sp.]